MHNRASKAIAAWAMERVLLFGHKHAVLSTSGRAMPNLDLRRAQDNWRDVFTKLRSGLRILAQLLASGRYLPRPSDVQLKGRYLNLYHQALPMSRYLQYYSGIAHCTRMELDNTLPLPRPTITFRNDRPSPMHRFAVSDVRTARRRRGIAYSAIQRRASPPVKALIARYVLLILTRAKVRTNYWFARFRELCVKGASACGRTARMPEDRLTVCQCDKVISILGPDQLSWTMNMSNPSLLFSLHQNPIQANVSSLLIEANDTIPKTYHSLAFQVAALNKGTASILSTCSPPTLPLTSARAVGRHKAGDAASIVRSAAARHPAMADLRVAPGSDRISPYRTISSA
ncbi:hypothetical protein J6590_027081 [Homalodisca vitripennis]|nr:hypothetical protein J6590_027081 [Homalodisca vitripennis]